MPKFSHKRKPKSKSLAKMVHKDHKLLRKVVEGERFMAFNAADGTIMARITTAVSTTAAPVVDTPSSIATGTGTGVRTHMRIQPLRYRLKMTISSSQGSSDVINPTGLKGGCVARVMVVWLLSPNGQPGTINASQPPTWEEILLVATGALTSEDCIALPSDYFKQKKEYKLLYDKTFWCPNRLVGAAGQPTKCHFINKSFDLSKLPPTTFNATGARSQTGTNISNGALYLIVFSDNNDNVGGNAQGPIYTLQSAFDYMG